MSGWGNKDKKSANTGTVAITAVNAGGGGGVVTGTNTLFDDELKVGNYVFVVSESLTYIVTSVTSNTVAVFRAGEPGNPAIVAVTGANTFYVTEKPKFASFGGAGAAVATSTVFGVSDQEVGRFDQGLLGVSSGGNGIGAAHAGWNRRTAKTDHNGVNRVLFETLVVQSARATTRAAMGDAPDDTVLPGSLSRSPSASISPSSSASASISPSSSRSPSASISPSASLSPSASASASRSPSASYSPSASRSPSASASNSSSASASPSASASESN